MASVVRVLLEDPSFPLSTCTLSFTAVFSSPASLPHLALAFAVPGITGGASESSDISRRWLLARCSQRELRRGKAEPPRYLPSGINQLDARLLERFALP